jgi:hypothetical protein
MFARSTGSPRNGQDEEVGNPASTLITVSSRKLRIPGGLLARKEIANEAILQ